MYSAMAGCFAARKNHSTVPNRPRMSNSRVEHVNDIPVNEPWPSCILAETWHARLFEIGVAYSRWRGKTQAHFEWSRERAKWSSCYFCPSNRFRPRVLLPLLQFDYSFRPAPACTRAESRCLRACFFGQPQLPRLMRSSNSASNRRGTSKRPSYASMCSIVARETRCCVQNPSTTTLLMLWI